MAFASSSSVICQNRALSSSVVSSSALLHHRCFSRLQSQRILHCNRRSSSNIGINASPGASSLVAKTALSDAHVQSYSSCSAPGPGWSDFAQNVSGEWDGYGADFSYEGTPIELPESVVPDAYREWEVKVFDWQTQCPTLAEPEQPSLMYKTIKLLPTVGCEADAATRYSIDERNIRDGIGGNDEVNAFGYQRSGCYVVVWPIEVRGSCKLMELEHCLVNPHDRESRVRVVQVVRVEGSRLVLQNIRVFCEQWYGPFRNGEQLGGCAIADSAFASTAALKASEVVGEWQGPVSVARFDGSQINVIQELLADNVQKSVRTESELKLLPKQLWCSLKESKDSGDTYCEVGWLFAHGHAITSRCIFSSTSKLKEISIANETPA
ncbi:uncharacterized protein LOC101221421 [Cucumis sativus]|uniref:Uncharacterized protein n=1 Tax=Cucumis sativus TaxID=3659 RepID=A0A0A0K0X9_CUCSA|nr:uncharacterized protein LOC101221421 [Cucumis sativus]KGN43355.1 hypothetical protein Csa_020358 [Cucumis sativus]